ncbi:two-component regulator propeller domain-containing protein [Lysobacter sp. FW306-1B-D06B]|uniref:sensor histidine kinase n=1 Tax=Lysobacter sp. FW306-1B-D06B TaxID=3140250 RepID=UPI0031402591
MPLHDVREEIGLANASNERGGKVHPARSAVRAMLASMCCLFALLVADAAHALDATRRIGQFHHTAWTVKEGAPGQVTALAQTRDGYLWLATQIGLFRFDGVQFERFEPTGSNAFPAASISTLYAPANGGLWVGFRYGAVSFIEGDRITHYGEADGLPTSTVFRFAQDHDGTLWAATFTGLVRLRGHRWERLGPQWRYPGKQARTVFVDAAGTLWVATEHQVAFLRKGATTFQSVAAPVGRISQIAQAPDGSIWVAESDGAVRALPLDVTPATRALTLPSAGLLFDRDGTLWANTLGEGVFRLAHPTAAAGGEATRAFEAFRRVDGLSSDYVQPILEDREGTVWIGSSRGLDRFRHSNVVPALLPEGAQDFAIAPDDSGALLAGTRNRPLMHLHGDRLTFLDVPAPITAAHRDRDGIVWLGGPDGLWALRAGRAAEVTALPVRDYSGVQAIAKDGDGALWVSLNTPGVYRLAQGKWQHFQDLRGMPEGSSPLTLLAANDGALWMGFARNKITLMRRGALQLLDTAQGLNVGNVTALFEGADGIWIGGERGLALYREGRVRSVLAGADDPFLGISGIVQTREGDLWLNGARGIVHVPAARVPRLFESGEGRVYERFDFLDGVPGIPAQFRPLPTAVQTDDGQLWFATTSGVVSIDPAAIARNPIPPPVRIRSLLANDRTWGVGAQTLALPAGVRNLQIAYTALSLSIPERVRFRYKLEGYDQDWQDAGTRRVAFYSDPGPGTYTFRVIAANNDGVWNELGASQRLTIAPRYYQTAWFRLLCALLAISVLWIAYLLRLRHLAGQIRLRMQERYMERERIARELHDTLLQGTQGLILRLHAASQGLREDDPVREDLEKALDLAEHALTEGRDRVRGLRGDVQYWHDLGSALLHVRDEILTQPLPDMRLIEEGKPRALLPGVAEELYLIGREAVLNALQHARANAVEIEVGYHQRELRLRVRDDGVGMHQHTPNRPGHWGLDGMSERAERLGAHLDVLSRPGAGTEVALRVPAAAAYARPTRSSYWRRLLDRLPWR